MGDIKLNIPNILVAVDTGHEYNVEVSADNNQLAVDVNTGDHYSVNLTNPSAINVDYAKLYYKTADFAIHAFTASLALTSSTILPSGLPPGTVSASSQISYPFLSNIPSGIISSSQQVINQLPSGTVSSSNQIILGLPVGTVSSSAQATLWTVATASYVTYDNVANKPTLISQSSQVDVRNTTGVSTLATTGSNTFTGIQVISNTTDATTYGSGSLVVYGGASIEKNLYVSGNLNIAGVLTVASMSTQYITSSQYIVGVNKIILNDDDLVRFAGISIVDSGSLSPTTASFYWDSLEHRFIYENLSGSGYNSAIFIAGPKNTGSLGNERGLIVGRVPVATGEDHIDSAASVSPLRIESGVLHVESGIYVTGSLSASGAFAGDFSGSLFGTASSATTAITASAATSITFTPVTSSFALTASYALNASGLPSGIISSSTQFNNLASPFTGSFTGSFFGEAIGFLFGTSSWASNAISASAATSITFVPSTASYADTASFVALSGLPTGLISQSSQVSYLNISNIPTGIVSSSTQVSYTGITGIPNGIVSSSAQATSWTVAVAALAVSSSYATTASYALNSTEEWNSIINKPVGLVSSSAQINTGSFTGSFSGNGSQLVGIQTASFAVTASYALNGSGNASISASYAETASYSVTASYLLGGTGPSLTFDGGTPFTSFVGGPTFDLGGVT